jgi:DNA (cytosine-5)-methyltransferase 1
MVLNSKFFGVPQNRERVFIIGSLRGQPRPEILPFRRNNQEVNELNKEPRQEINIIDDVARINKGKQGDRVKMDGDCFTLNSIEQRGVAVSNSSAREFKWQNENCPTILGRDYKQPKIVKVPSIEDKEIGVAIPGSQAMRVYTDELAPTLKGPGGGMGAKTGLYCINPYNHKTSSEETGTLGISCGTSTGKTAQHIHSDFKIRRLTPTECERLQGFPDGWTLGFSDTQRYKMMGNAVTVNVIRAIAQRLCSQQLNAAPGQPD